MSDTEHIDEIDADGGCIEIAEALQALREEERAESGDN